MDELTPQELELNTFLSEFLITVPKNKKATRNNEA